MLVTCMFVNCDFLLCLDQSWTILGISKKIHTLLFVSLENSSIIIVFFFNDTVQAVESLDKLNSGPLLKFHLEWTNKPIDITPPSTATAPSNSSSAGAHSNLSPRSPHQASAGSRSPASHKLENGVEPMDTAPSCGKLAMIILIL